MMPLMELKDPFEGLGKALALLRERAGFSTQTEAAERLRFEKSQLSRWENENPRPTLENLSRLLASYGASVADLSLALGEAEPADPGPTDEELLRSLEEALRRVEGRVERLERGQNLADT